MIYSKQMLVCVNKENEVQGMDQSSGGYPFVAANIRDWYDWSQRPIEEARKYAKTFDFRLENVTVTAFIPE